MKYILIFVFLCIALVDSSSVYNKYINTNWGVTSQSLSQCISTCKTCCISSFKIQQNGANGAGMVFYFDSTTLSRCGTNYNGPFSMTFNTLTTNPLTSEGFSSVGTAGQVTLYPNSASITYNDSSKTSCYAAATLLGTLNPSNAYFLVPSLLLMFVSLLLI